MQILEFSFHLCMNFTSSIFLILLLLLHTFESPIMSLYAQMQLFSLLCMYCLSLILTKIPFSSCFGLVFYLYFTLIWFLSDFYPGFYFKTLLCQWDLEISDRLFRPQCSFCIRGWLNGIVMSLMMMMTMTTRLLMIEPIYLVCFSSY